MYSIISLTFPRSQVPEISIPKQILNYGRCFIHYPYELCINLYNETDLDAKYEIFPQAENNFESSPISYRSPKPKVSTELKKKFLDKNPYYHIYILIPYVKMYTELNIKCFMKLYTS